MDELTTAETAELETCVETVKRGQQTYIEVGAALLTIRDKRLYRVATDTFEDFCQAEFGFSRQRAHQLIDAAGVVTLLMEDESVNHGLQTSDEFHKVPVSERVAREVSKVEPTKRKAVLKKAEDTAPQKNGKPNVTAAHVRRVAKEQDPAPIAKDSAGQALPDDLIDVFSRGGQFRSFMRDISNLKAGYEKLCQGPAGAYAVRELKRFNADVGNLHAVVRFVMPYAVCPYCGGRKCDSCKRAGWMPEEIYKAVPRDIRGVA